MKGSVIMINGGVVQHCSLTKNCMALRLFIPGMMGNSYHCAKGFYDLLKGRFGTCR